MQENFATLNKRRALEHPTFQANPNLITPSPNGMRSRDSGLPHDTRNIVDSSGTFFERLRAREGRSYTLFNNSKSKNLAASSQELSPAILGNTQQPQSYMRRELKNLSIPVPRCQSRSGLLNHTDGTILTMV